MGANEKTEPRKLVWEPITVKVYSAKDAEFIGGISPDGCSGTVSSSVPS